MRSPEIFVSNESERKMPRIQEKINSSLNDDSFIKAGKNFLRTAPNTGHFKSKVGLKRFNEAKQNFANISDQFCSEKIKKQNEIILKKTLLRLQHFLISNQVIGLIK